MGPGTVGASPIVSVRPVLRIRCQIPQQHVSAPVPRCPDQHASHRLGNSKRPGTRLGHRLLRSDTSFFSDTHRVPVSAGLCHRGPRQTTITRIPNASLVSLIAPPFPRFINYGTASGHDSCDCKLSVFGAGGSGWNRGFWHSQETSSRQLFLPIYQNLGLPARR
jgi:hypothetical protein